MTELQLTAIDQILADYNEAEMKAAAKNVRKREFLLENGFVEGEDFEYLDMWSEAFRTVWMKDGKVSKHEPYISKKEKEMDSPPVITTIEFPYRRCKGSCHLVYYHYASYDKEVKRCKTDFSIEKGKISAYSLTSNFRYMKPATILKKVRDSKKIADYEYKEANLENKRYQDTAAELIILYPEAEVTFSNAKYSGGSIYYKTVKVKFANGSYVEVRPSMVQEGYYVVAKHDAEYVKLGANSLLKKFAEQNK